MSKTSSSPTKSRTSHPTAKGLIYLSAAFILFLSLISFTTNAPSHNWLGWIGFSVAWLLQWTLGLSSYFLAIGLALLGWEKLAQPKNAQTGQKTLFLSLFLLSSSLLLNLLAEHGLTPAFLQHKILSQSLLLDYPSPHTHTRFYAGGVPFYYLYCDLSTFNLQKMLSDVGIFLTSSTLAIVSFLLFFDIDVLPLWEKTKLGTAWLFLQGKKSCKKLLTPSLPSLKESKVAEKLGEALRSIPQPLYQPNQTPELKIRTFTESPCTEEKKSLPTDTSQPAATKRQKALDAQRVYNGDFAHYRLPPLSLLKNPKKVDHPAIKKELRRQAEILEETLLSFGIEAKVGEIHCGPTITSFEVQPAIGVKVQKITALENDIALNLQAKAIRIIAPIPGKAAVGVEIPSLYPQEVSFKEMIHSYQSQSRKQHIPILLGKTVSGENVISDLTKMPHCIIAGATGSGKSVCINTVILSILMTARPDEIKLLLVDPKKVELTPYRDLPHMIAPVITEAHGAYAALSWLVKEMQTRYEILKQLGLRNIGAFNARQPNPEFESSLSIAIPKRMYSIVAIIDEFADLMMASSADLETPIARIAQMARAVGIHLILATQRPSREVITGLIKANFPTRIAFKVASRINSQIILDENGAETLLGNGDLLFLPPGSSHLIRAQGAYVSDEEIQQIVSFIADQAPPNYLIPSFDQMTKELFDLAENSSDAAGRDSLYEQAMQIVLETQNASTTFLQRKLKIGYARAASLMDELESNSVIGPQEGSKPRKILIKSPQSSFLNEQDSE